MSEYTEYMPLPSFPSDAHMQPNKIFLNQIDVLYHLNEDMVSVKFSVELLFFPVAQLWSMSFLL